MKTPDRKALLATVLYILSSVVALPADTLDTGRSKIYFDNLENINPWIRSTNPAGLVFLENLKRINMAGFSYNMYNKGLKFPAEPGLTNSFNAETRGLGKLGKLAFSGYFGYNNEHYNDLFYNNTLIFDPDNPYILGDTVGGKQQKEGFILKGAIAYPLNSKISFGISADYENYVGAKLKDPRNKNDISSLVITPGIIFKAGHLTTGLSGGAVITNNDVSVSVTEDAKYSLLQFLGFGYYKPVLNIYSYSNTYYGNGYNVQAQLKYDSRNYFNFLIVSFNTLKEEVRYGSSNRLTDGISNNIVISVNDNQVFLKGKSKHQVDLSFSMRKINGTEMMQHFETVVHGSFRYDTLITDKRTKGKHIATNYTGTLGYTWSGYRAGTESLRLTAGSGWEYMTSSHYPVQTNGSQKVMNLSPYASLKKYMSLKSLILIPELGVKYRMNLMKDKTYTVTKWSEPEYQQQDYIARSTDCILGNADLSLIKKTRFKNIPEYFIDLGGTYTYFPEDITGPAHNFFLNTSIGLIF